MTSVKIEEIYFRPFFLLFNLPPWRSRVRYRKNTISVQSSMVSQSAFLSTLSRRRFFSHFFIILSAGVWSVNLTWEMQHEPRLTSTWGSSWRFSLIVVDVDVSRINNFIDDPISLQHCFKRRSLSLCCLH